MPKAINFQPVLIGLIFVFKIHIESNEQSLALACFILQSLQMFFQPYSHIHPEPIARVKQRCPNCVLDESRFHIEHFHIRSCAISEEICFPFLSPRQKAELFISLMIPDSLGVRGRTIAVASGDSSNKNTVLFPQEAESHVALYHC